MSAPDTPYEQAVDDCRRRIREGEPLASCIARYPAELQAELAELILLSVKMERLWHDPSADFMTRLQGQIKAASLAKAKENPNWAQRLGSALANLPADAWRALGAGGPLWRAVAVILIVGVVTIGSSVGVVQAADETLPDHPLYPVKTAREWVEENIARDGDARNVFLMRQAGRRVAELSRVVEAGKPRLVVELASARVLNSTRRGVAQAIEQQERGNPRPAQRALPALQNLRQQVDKVANGAPPRYRGALQRLSLALAEEERNLAGGKPTSLAPPGAGPGPAWPGRRP
jgi:hypothetical protein